MDKNYDSVVVFDKAIRIPYIEKTIYGFVLNQEDSETEDLEKEIHSYVEYLLALVKWNSEGGTISEDASIWFKDDDTVYIFSKYDGYLADVYLPDAYKQNPINYKILYGNAPKFDEGDLYDNNFITKNIRGLWKRGNC